MLIPKMWENRDREGGPNDRLKDMCGYPKL